jgi:hypothetical protein
MLHQAALQTALQPGDLIDEPGGAAGWRPHSVRKTAAGFGRYLDWSASKGHDIAAPLERLVTRERVIGFLKHVGETCRSMTVMCRAQELYDAVRVMAPGSDWLWLKRIYMAMLAEAHPERDKLSRLRSAQEIEDLGLTLMREAEAEGSKLSPLKRALLYRDGLIITLLIRRLPRLGNLTALEIGRNLIELGKGTELRFSGDETKSCRPSFTTLPEFLEPSLQRYLEHYRPLLLASNGKGPAEDHAHLWVSAVGTPMAEISLHNAIRRRTTAAFGKPIPPHWFRDAAVTTVVIHNPHHARDTRELLHHESHGMADKHYNQGQSIVGVMRYQASLADFLDQLADD